MGQLGNQCAFAQRINLKLRVSILGRHKGVDALARIGIKRGVGRAAGTQEQAQNGNHAAGFHA